MMGVPQWRSPEKEKQSAKSAKRKGGFGVVCDKNSFEEQAAAKRLSTQACTYPNKFVRSDKKRTFQVLKRDLPKRGCCCKQECCSRYKPEQVAAVRAYFLSLAKADRRAFCHQRHQRQVVEDRQEDKEGFYVLEDPSAVESKFNATAHGCLTEVALLDGMRRCCAKWLAWCLGISHTTLSANAVTRDGLHSTGSSPMERDVLEWLHECKEYYLVMPHLCDSQKETATVAPWRTFKAAHAAYIHEREKANRTGRYGEDGDDYAGVDDWDDNIEEDGDDSPHSCEAANCQGHSRCCCHDLEGIEDQFDQHDRERDAEEDDDENMFQEQDDDEDARKDPCAPTREPKRAPYRYGNTLLGLTRDGPQDSTLCTYAHFNKVWRRDSTLRKYLLVRKYIPFAKCDLCFKFRSEGYHTKDKTKANEARKKHAKHLEEMRKNRDAVEAERRRARRDPDEVMVLAIDGAENGKNDLPHFEELTKHIAASKGATMHLTGVLDEGRRPRVFVGLDNVKQGHNVTIQV